MSTVANDALTLRWDLASGEVAHEVAQKHGNNDSDYCWSVSKEADR
jgi:hypothetical protein